MEVHYVLRISMMYRIRLIATPGFYFSKWVFGWGSIQKIPEKVEFLNKKGGLFKKNPKKELSTLPGALFKSGAAIIVEKSAFNFHSADACSICT